MNKLLPLVLLVIFSCNQKEINIEDFDAVSWKDDPAACKDQRENLGIFLLENRTELIGHSSNEIVNYLGKPDHVELYTRNQKFFHYYITPGPECGEDFNDLEHDRLSLRFNATGMLKEVSLYN